MTADNEQDRIEAIARDAKALWRNAKGNSAQRLLARNVFKSIDKLKEAFSEKTIIDKGRTILVGDAADLRPLTPKKIFFIGYWAGSLGLGASKAAFYHPQALLRAAASKGGRKGAETKKTKASAWRVPAEKEIVALWRADETMSNPDLANATIESLHAKGRPCRGDDAVLALVKKLRGEGKIPKKSKSAKTVKKQ